MILPASEKSLVKFLAGLENGMPSIHLTSSLSICAVSPIIFLSSYRSNRVNSYSDQFIRRFDVPHGQSTRKLWVMLSSGFPRNVEQNRSSKWCDTSTTECAMFLYFKLITKIVNKTENIVYQKVYLENVKLRDKWHIAALFLLTRKSFLDLLINLVCHVKFFTFKTKWVIIKCWKKRKM